MKKENKKMSTSLVKKVCKRTLNGTFKWKSAGIAIFMAFLMLSSVFIVFSNPAATTVKAQTTTSPTTSVSQSPWPMFGYNEARYRDNKNSTAPTTGHILWTAQTGGAVESSPAINYGMVYVGSDDHNVYAFDEQTGALVWKYQTGGIVYSSPAVVNNMVYVGSDDDNVYCLNAATGALVWKYTTGDSVFSSPAVVNGYVYIGSTDYYFYCLNAATGALVWKFGPTEGPIYCSPAYADGNVFFGTAGGVSNPYYPGYAENNFGYLYQLDATTGEQLWKFETSLYILGSPAISDTFIYFATNSFRWNNIYGLDWTTHQIMWTTKVGAEEFCSPAVSAGAVYIGGTDWYLYDFSGLEGYIAWDTKTTGEITSSPAVADGMVYVGGTDDWFYCFNQTNGNLLWRMETGGPITSSPAIADGNVYIGSGDGCLYCFGYLTTLTTTTNYPWVIGGHDSQATFSTQSPGPSTPTVLWVAQVGYVIPLDRSFENSPNSAVLPLQSDWTQHGSPPLSGGLPVNSADGEGDIEEWLTSPVVSNGTVYFTGWGTYAFDALTGKQLWWNYLGGETRSDAPVIIDDGILSIPQDGVALNATTGANLYTGSPVADNMYNGNFYGGYMTLSMTWQINYTNGAVIQLFNPGVSPSFHQAPIYTGIMYGVNPYLPAANGTSNIIGMDLSTGKIVFESQSFSVGEEAGCIQQIAADGKMFVPLETPGMGVAAVSLTTGKILWETKTEDLQQGMAYANGIIYQKTYGTLWAMDANTGNVLWKFTSAPAFGAGSPAVSGDGKIYVGFGNGDFYCLNATTGAVIWKYQTHGAIGSDVSIAGGVVYVASCDGFLYAFADNQSLAAAGVSQRVYDPSVAADASQSSTTPSTTAISQTVAANPINPASPTSASWPITAYVAVAAAVAVAVVATVVAATMALKRSKRK